MVGIEGFKKNMQLCLYTGRGSSDILLSTVLNFFTGADEIPPCGFPHDGVLSFNAANPFPTASTCAVELTLPTQYNNFYSFKQKMDIALLYHGGFGLS